MDNKDDLLSDDGRPGAGEDEDFSRGNNKIHPSKTYSKEFSSRPSKLESEAIVQGIKSIDSKQQMDAIKDLMTKKGAKIAMNVLKIALNKEEEKLAR